MPHATKKPPVEMRWKQLAEETRAEAIGLPHGRARDAMLKKAEQLDTACRVNEWISSPGRRPPAELAKLKSYKLV